jgi:tRNA(Leu) C34 or U34 (ribose-2'-O)-methylase TrmL
VCLALTRNSKSVTASQSAAIGLCNPKSPANVGSVLRAAGCYGVEKIYYTGTRFTLASKYQADTQRMSDKVRITAVESFIPLAEAHLHLVCIELVEGAMPLPEFEHPDNALYIFGPEDGSVPQSVVDAADAVVYIPTIGCMNLAATVNVLLYDRLAKQKLEVDHLEQVKKNRDGNNRLVRKQKA